MERSKGVIGGHGDSSRSRFRRGVMGDHGSPIRRRGVMEIHQGYGSSQKDTGVRREIMGEHGDPLRSRGVMEDHGDSSRLPNQSRALGFEGRSWEIMEINQGSARSWEIMNIHQG